jgi:adenylosuccinate synthase
MDKASIVIDLGFGDSGKGVTVDFLCAQKPTETLVVRFSGGHQVGHTVELDGVRHTFSNFGAGTLRGVSTFYSPHTVIFPPALLHEWTNVARYAPVVYYHPQVQVATPYDIAYNLALEKQQGHGSCGVGFGATVARGLDGYKLHAHDLTNRWILKEKLQAIQAYYNQKVRRTPIAVQEAYWKEADYVDTSAFEQICLEAIGPVRLKPLKELASEFRHFVFEGSQGIMLDQDHGFFPHVTRSHTTSRNAFSIIKEQWGSQLNVDMYYVTRCYQTRHGAGPMSMDKAVTLVNTEYEANRTNQHQGVFRTAELDVDLLRYAHACDRAYHPPHISIDENLVVTCLDQRPNFELDQVFGDWLMDFKSVHTNSSTASSTFTRWGN